MEALRVCIALTVASGHYFMAAARVFPKQKPQGGGAWGDLGISWHVELRWRLSLLVLDALLIACLYGSMLDLKRAADSRLGSFLSPQWSLGFPYLFKAGWEHWRNSGPLQQLASPHMLAVIAAGYVLGWMLVISPALQWVAVSQFSLPMMAVQALRARMKPSGHTIATQTQADGKIVLSIDAAERKQRGRSWVLLGLCGPWMFKHLKKLEFSLLAWKIHNLVIDARGRIADEALEAKSLQRLKQALHSFVVEHERLGLLDELASGELTLYEDLDLFAPLGSFDNFPFNLTARIPSAPQQLRWCFQELLRLVDVGHNHVGHNYVGHNYCRLVDVHDFTFVDFGCGTGVAMVTAMSYPFLTVCGIELDADTAASAVLNIEVCRSKPFSRCNGANVLNMDAQDYEFTSEHTVLFMFEPLAFVATDVARSIYSKVVGNAAKAGVELIIYLEGRCIHHSTLGMWRKCRHLP